MLCPFKSTPLFCYVLNILEMSLTGHFPETLFKFSQDVFRVSSLVTVARVVNG